MHGCASWLAFADEIHTKVEAMVNYKVAGIPWDQELAKWTDKLHPVIYNKLVAVKLLPKRAEIEQTKLAAFLDDTLAERNDIKPRTRIGLTQVRNDLVAFFGADRPLDEIH